MLPYTVLLRTVPILVILTCSAPGDRLSPCLFFAYFRQNQFMIGNFCIYSLQRCSSSLSLCLWLEVLIVWDGDTEPTWGKLSGKLYYLFI